MYFLNEISGEKCVFRVKCLEKSVALLIKSATNRCTHFAFRIQRRNLDDQCAVVNGEVFLSD